MTDQRNNSNDVDPITELHAQLAADPLTDDDAQAMGASERLIDNALAHRGLEAMSDDARLMLLALTDESESLEPQARQRLVAAANRGLQSRRFVNSPLPLLLFVCRRETGRQLDELAAALDVPQKDLKDIEAGERPLRTLSAEHVAAWIAQLDIRIDQAEHALHECLAASNVTKRAAANTERTLSPEDETFARAVLDHLRSLTS